MSSDHIAAPYWTTSQHPATPRAVTSTLSAQVTLSRHDYAWGHAKVRLRESVERALAQCGRK